MADSYKISLGIDFNDSELKNIKKQLTNLTDNTHRIRIDIDNSRLLKQIEHAKKELRELNGAKGKQPSLTVNTQSLERSLSRVADVIDEVRKSLGTLDDKSGMKSLVSSVNQIATALGKAENESDNLIKSLNALSKKDFSINVGIDMGKKNTSTLAYGRMARKEVMPELKKQIKYLEDLFGGESAAATKLSSYIGFDGLESILSGFNSKATIQKMEAMEKYINTLKKVASIENPDGLNKFNNAFAKSATEMINDITGIESAVDKAGDVPQKIKNLLGGSVDGEKLSASLESIVSNLKKINDAVVNLSKGVSLEGLNSSFNKLSETLEKLLDSYVLVKKNLDGIGSGSNTNNAGNAGVENLEQDLKRVTTEAKNTANAMEYITDILTAKGVDSKNIDKVTADLKELGIEISNVTTKITTNGLNISVKGIDDLGRAVTVVRQFDEEFRGETIAQSFDTSADAVKRWKKEVSNAYQDAKKLKTEIGKQEVDLIGAKAKDDAKEIDRITKRITALKTELKGVMDVYGGSFTTRHNNLLKQLDDKIADNKLEAQNKVDYKLDLDKAKAEAKQVSDAFSKIYDIQKKIGSLEVDLVGAEAKNDIKTIDAINDEITRLKKNMSSLDKDGIYSSRFTEAQKADLKELNELIEYSKKQAQNKVDYKLDLDKAKAEVREVNEAYKQMLETRKQIRSLSIKEKNLSESGNTNELNEVSAKLKELKADYDALNRTFGSKLNPAQFGTLQAEIDETESELKQLDAKWADTKAKLAKNITLDIDGGKFDDELSAMYDKFNKLSSASKDLRQHVEAVENAYREMELAAGRDKDGKGVFDAEKLAAAYEKYEAALAKANNQLRIQAREEAAVNRAQKLAQDKASLKLDTLNWLKENTKAIKKYGGELKELLALLDKVQDQSAKNNIASKIDLVKKRAKNTGDIGLTAWDRLIEKAKEYSVYISAADIFMRASQAISSMFEQVKLIDSAMTELKKVTDETDASYNQFLSNAASKAKELGTTIDGLVSSTADFARLGYGFEEAQGLAEVANIYAVVGDEIEGVEGATESLISTLAAFKDQASGISDTDFAMDIVDKFNEVSNNYSISSGGIGEALQRSASSMAAANNTLDESISLIVAANQVTQDPQVVGNAMKTISMRIRGKFVPIYNESYSLCYAV